MGNVLKKEEVIYVGGHQGMVGSAIVRELKSRGFTNIVTATRSEVDLTNQCAVSQFFSEHKLDHVVLAAAKVGGIHANDQYSGQFIYENLMIECNLIQSAFQAGIDRLLFLGSSCIYPRLARQPMKENELLTGPLESTNEPYAIAKIAGIKLCESFNRQYGTHYRSVMPTNLYGQGDNFHPENSHVIPGLLHRFHEAKISAANSVIIWGTGVAMREFLYVDDMAEACVHVMGIADASYDAQVEPMLSHVNIGTGKDISIRELARLIQQIVGFEGELIFDSSKPDGTPRKLIDPSKLARMGWSYSIELEEGLEKTYQWYLENSGKAEVIRGV